MPSLSPCHCQNLADNKCLYCIIRIGRMAKQQMLTDLKEVDNCLAGTDKDQVEGRVLELYQELFGCRGQVLDETRAPILSDYSPNELSKELYKLHKRRCECYTRQRQRDFENAMRAAKADDIMDIRG